MRRNESRSVFHGREGQFAARAKERDASVQPHGRTSVAKVPHNMLADPVKRLARLEVASHRNEHVTGRDVPDGGWPHIMSNVLDTSKSYDRAGPVIAKPPEFAGVALLSDAGTL